MHCYEIINIIEPVYNLLTVTAPDRVMSQTPDRVSNPVRGLAHNPVRGSNRQEVIDWFDDIDNFIAVHQMKIDTELLSEVLFE
ncbi:MAG: hypothetical protein R6X09_13380 [Bacteroidales bacterium]